MSAQKSYTSQIISNPSFESSDNWSCIIDGDLTDVNASAYQGEAQYNVKGEHRVFSFVSDPPLASDWVNCSNPEYSSFPDVYEINSSGACVSHYWWEGPDQVVAVNWDKNLTMVQDFSDYEITSAQISAVVNGSVETFSADPPDYSDGVDTANDNCDEFSNGDNVRFYIKISDLEKRKEYEIAHYQTTDLGQDSGPEIATLNDTQLISISEESLILFLTSVLNTDNHNFTLTIGMRIWCEDNFPQDSDRWNLLIIKSVNLTFSYEKKIDKFTTITWGQIGGAINDLSDYRIELTDALLNFKYSLDSTWPSSLSPNSEIRIFVNNNKLLETIKLIDSNSTFFFQDAKPGGFQVQSLISEEENVSISIQLYLADEFILNKTITISIDDVFLEISYVEFIPEQNNIIPIVIGVLLVIIGILGALSLRSYILIPRIKKKKSFLMLRTQRFKDIRNIQGIILIHRESGLPIFSHSYSKLMEGKKTLFSGFIQAVSIIGEEMSNDDPKKSGKGKLSKKIDFQKIVELDLKRFFCLILDIEELRSVLILKSKSSKRTKRILFNFTLALYLEISKKLEDFDNDLTDYPKIINPLLNEYFELYYKENFITDYSASDLQEIKKKYRLSKTHIHIMENIFSIL
ncbi:MAG: hypothetical protein ACW990_19365, partial [Promethearchaeota archaeon]